MGLSIKNIAKVAVIAVVAVAAAKKVPVVRDYLV